MILYYLESNSNDDKKLYTKQPSTFNSLANIKNYGKHLWTSGFWNISPTKFNSKNTSRSSSYEHILLAIAM